MVPILFTGGTISMRLDPATGAAVPALSGQDILDHVPGLAAIAEVEGEDVSRLPGPHVTPEHMWRLARRAAAWLERPDVQGLVVTHGTDTLEETAYLLDLLLLSEKPVVHRRRHPHDLRSRLGRARQPARRRPRRRGPRVDRAAACWW